MEQSTTEGDYSLPLVHCNSPAAPCYHFWKTHIHTHTHNKSAQICTHIHFSTHVSGIAEAIILDWINLWHGMKSKGVSRCLQRGAAVFGVTCGQIISNELCKSPQSNTGRQWVMLTTPSQWDYMNIFIGQQKAKESQRRAFSIVMKASSFVLMTRKAEYWILISGLFHRDALYS